MENKVVDNREEKRIEREADIRFPDTGYVMDEHQNQKNEWRRFGYIAGATFEAARNKEDAIGFAEWAFGDDINPFVFSKGRWIQACGNSTSWSTEQLYEMYINQKV